jgi:dolichol-phosphate mannosyltransferase
VRAHTQGDSRFILISLSRNFGHQAAVTAALDQSSGDVVVVLDGDLQDPPEFIPRLIEEANAGYDVVYVQRQDRKESLLLRACYAAFYRILGVLAEFPIPLDAGDFCIMTKRVVAVLKSNREHRRFVRGLRAWAGFRQKGVTLARDARKHGRTKYSLTRLVRLAADGVFSFSTVPIRFATLVGTMATVLSTLFVVYAIFARVWLGESPSGFTATITLMTFFFGLQVMVLGVIGEYVGRIYEEVKARPLYLIESVTRG